MKKIILSVAVATMALSTTASALEDIKVSGDAKVWYETDNADNAAKAAVAAVAATPGNVGSAATAATPASSGSMFNKADATAEVVFKLGMTGKQGNVGFGAEVTQGSTMGLESVLVSNVRTEANNVANQTGTGDMYVSKAYITAPVAPSTIIKLGRQELNTPFAFTEKWNAQQNNFDAAVFVNNSVSDLTIIGAYVGQTNTANANQTGGKGFKATQEFGQIAAFAGGNGAFALAALYKTDSLSVNAWAYDLSKVAKAFWVDAGMSVGPVALKAYAATMMPSDTLGVTLGGIAVEDTTAFALSAASEVGGIKLFAAASMVAEDGTLAVANVATGGKKTKLPTAGVYTDGVYVAVEGSTAIKVKAAGKVGSTGLALQLVNNTNSSSAYEDAVTGDNSKDTTEMDLIISQKVGDFNLKGIVMHRDFAADNVDAQQHVRVIASVKF